MSIATIEPAEFGQEMTAFAIVVNSLARSVTEIKDRAALKFVGDTMDSMTTLAKHIEHALDDVDIAEDKVVSFPVEFEIKISDIKKSLHDRLGQILNSLADEKLIVFDNPSRYQLLAKIKKAQHDLDHAFARLESMKSCDAWDFQMYEDAENGCFDDLINEANKAYDEGKVRFR